MSIISNGDRREQIIKLNCALELERKIVGIRFIFSEEDYVRADAKQLANKMN